jgi:molecular chaperone GrpE
MRKVYNKFRERKRQMEENKELKEDAVNTASEENSSENTENTEVVEDEKNEELEKALNDAKEANDKYLRLFAEFDNYRKRTTKEKTECYSDATVKCIEQLLPVLDSFELAIKTDCLDENYGRGMEMILNQFKTILEKMEVKEIEALGAPFDPNIHNAIKQEESDEYESDTVCEVFQKGYMLKERLIRPAMVAVVG